MDIDAVTYRTIARMILGRETALTPEEAIAIVQLAELTVGADLDVGADESTLLQQLTDHVCAIGGLARNKLPVASPLPLDREERARWFDALRAKLPSTGARELAYVTSYLLTIGDLEIAPVEITFEEELQRALGIDDDRASDLVSTVAAMVTPEERVALSGDETSPDAR